VVQSKNFIHTNIIGNPGLPQFWEFVFFAKRIQFYLILI